MWNSPDFCFEPRSLDDPDQPGAFIAFCRLQRQMRYTHLGRILQDLEYKQDEKDDEDDDERIDYPERSDVPSRYRRLGRSVTALSRHRRRQR
jgi:hypothetical protein